MDRLERFYKIDQLLQERTVVARDAFLDELEVSLATFKRDLEYMRDRFNAPVVWDASARRLSLRACRRKFGPSSRCRDCGSTKSEALRAGHDAAPADLARPGRADRPAHRAAGRRGWTPSSAPARPPPAEVRKRIRLLSLRHAQAAARALRRAGLGAVQAPPPEDRLLRAQHRHAHHARSLAAAPRLLPRELVRRHLVPPARRPAQLLRRRHPPHRDRRHRRRRRSR